MSMERRTRRQFLSVGAAAAAGVPAMAAVAIDAAAQAQAPRDAVPPAIAALTPMRGEAVPIAVDERRARIERARERMAAERLGAIVLTGGTSLTYFTGMRWGVSERLFAVVVPRDGAAFCVCPAFEEDRAREQLAAGPLADADVLTWQEDESPYGRLAGALRPGGLATARVGLDETMRFVFADGLAHAAPALELVSATPVTAGCRMIKDAHEIALMRLAARATLRAYEAVYRSLREGMREDEVGRLVSAAYGRLGFPGGASVTVGEYTALPHGSATPQVIREGTIIMIDDGCSAEGYQSDITRTFVLGRPTDAMRRVFDIVRRAQDAALRAARPGVPLAAIDQAARDVIAAAGYGPGFRTFTHRVGHGLGMDMHEWPYLIDHNMYGWPAEPRLAPGMVFSDEPGIYLRGEFGVRLEDDLLVTAEGAELFTPQSRSLEEPFK